MNDTTNELSALVQGLAAEIDRRKARGERHCASPAESTPSRPEVPGRGKLRADPGGQAASSAAQESVAQAAQACPDLAALGEAVARCTACELSKSRIRPAFAGGSQASAEGVQVLFLSDAPGAAEEASGRPMDGAEGQLLRDIITKGMQLPLDRVHITQLVKCRPAGDRPASTSEMETCSGFLKRELELLNPKLVLALGARAAEHLLNVDKIDSEARGKVHELGGRKLIPTFHPSFLLKNPARKRDCWQDIQVALGEL